MRIVIAVLGAVFALASGLAQAQTYRWVDKDGKVRYGDYPPTGIKGTPLKGPASGAAPSAPSPSAGSKDAGSKNGAAKDAKKGPLTPAEQEQAYRDRQLKSKEAKEKSDKEQTEAEQLKQACASAQEGLRGYERGGRISSINAQGETVILEDEQRLARIEQLRKTAAETCK